MFSHLGGFHLQFFSASSSSRPVSDFHFLNAPSVLTGPCPWDSHPFTQVGSWLPLPTGPFSGTSLRPRRRYSNLGRTFRQPSIILRRTSHPHSHLTVVFKLSPPGLATLFYYLVASYSLPTRRFSGDQVDQVDPPYAYPLFFFSRIYSNFYNPCTLFCMHKALCKIRDKYIILHA
jgi:hypothetical protein